MAVIHMYNGGEAGTSICAGTQYPREAPCETDRLMRVAAEKFPGSAWLSRSVDFCNCNFTEALDGTKGATCSALEVGDIIGMAVAPPCMLYKGVAYHVVSGVEGVEFDILRVALDCDAETPPVPVEIATGISAAPLVGVPAEIPTEPCVRIPWDSHCGTCRGGGACGWYSASQSVTIDVSDAQDASVLVPVGVPAPEWLTEPAYFQIRISALPVGFSCTDCCLEIMISVGLEETRQGN